MKIKAIWFTGKDKPESQIFVGDLIWVRQYADNGIIFQYDDGIKYHDIDCDLMQIVREEEKVYILTDGAEIFKEARMTEDEYNEADRTARICSGNNVRWILKKSDKVGA